MYDITEKYRKNQVIMSLLYFYKEKKGYIIIDF